MKKSSMRIDPSPVPVAVTHSWYMDEDTWESQPERTRMQLHKIRQWERVREMSRMEKYHAISMIKQLTQAETTEALTDAVKDMNNWLFKRETGEHPNNVFVNFLKKSLGKKLGNIRFLEYENKKGLKPNNTVVHVENNTVRDLHFYNTSWPDYGNALVDKLRIAAASIDYKKLGGTATGGTTTTTIANAGFEGSINSILHNIADFKFK